MDMPKFNLKDPKVIAGIVALVIVGVYLYRKRQAAASAGPATTPGQVDASTLDPNATGQTGDPNAGNGSGSTGTSGGPDLSGYTTSAQEQADILGLQGTISSVEGQIPGDVTAALTAAGFVPNGSTSQGATGGDGQTSALQGPLNGLPVAAQIALVRAGLATSAQLGPNAARIYAAGGDRTPASHKQPTRQESAAAGRAAHREQQQDRAQGHTTHQAGNAAHGQRSHAPAPPKPTPHPSPGQHPKPAPPRPAQRRPTKAHH